MKTITCYKSEDNKIHETQIDAELADARLAITRIENCNGAIQDFIINHWRLILAILQKIDLPDVACETNNEKLNQVEKEKRMCQRCATCGQSFYTETMQQSGGLYYCDIHAAFTNRA